MKDLLDVGLRNDKFAVVSKLNRKCIIAIRKPVGLTERFEMKWSDHTGDDNNMGLTSETEKSLTNISDHTIDDDKTGLDVGNEKT